MLKFAPALPLLLASLAAADEGVTVTALGEAKAAPETLLMAVSVVGDAEMAGDAVTKYRGQRERFLEAVKALGIKGLETRDGAAAVGQRAAQAGNQGRVIVNGVVQQQGTAPGAFTVTERVVIALPAGDGAMDQAARIYDLGRDLGVPFVPPAAGGSLIQAEYGEAAGPEAAAAEDAMKTAREKASRLAALAGGELGDVLEVTAMDVPAAKGAAADSLSEKTTRAKLRVRFALK